MKTMNKIPVPKVESISFTEGFKNHGLRDVKTLTPRPIPQARFFQERLSFSTKKEKGTPRDSLPPRPPVKSAPPVSRIFTNKVESTAKPISFKSPEISSQAISPYYNAGSKELYFDQCFHMESKLGAGSFGEVFKVRSKEDGRLYAIKRSKDRFKGECDRKRKLEEVAKHEKLRRHPNCVTFHKAWEEKKHLYIQTELCSTSLKNLSDQNHNIPEKLIKNYIVDLLMAVKHLHDSDLVHMDIKPENIFITESGVCKLGDFGLVIDMSDQFDTSNAQEGDPKYLAPELMQGQYGKPADLFSLGLTFLELASDLDLPRGGELWHQLREKRIPNKLLCDMCPDLSRIITSMLEPDPQIRPTVDQLLTDPFVKQIWKKRRREQAIRSVGSLWTRFLHCLWGFLMTLWLTLIYPLHSIIPTQIYTPKKPSGLSHPPDWDYSLSEDEIGHDDTISINNSLCAPLDFSTSSDDSFKDDGFSIPRVPPRQGVPNATYSLMRSRTPRFNSTEISESLSPFSSPRHKSSSTLDETGTPNTSCSRNLIQDLDNELFLLPQNDSKSSIEPKNLLDAFDGVSSDED